MPDEGDHRPWVVAGTDVVGTALAVDLRRVADRLRTLSQARLVAPAPPHASRAAAARAVAQLLAEAEQGIAARQQPAEPVWRQLPDLGELAVGDQLAVTGNDLLNVTGQVAPDDEVWARGGRRTALEIVTQAAEHLAALRRTL